MMPDKNSDWLGIAGVLSCQYWKGSYYVYRLYKASPGAARRNLERICISHTRIVELHPYRLLRNVKTERTVILGQISQRTLAYLCKLYGYIELKLSWFDRPVLFNPQVSFFHVSQEAGTLQCYFALIY